MHTTCDFLDLVDFIRDQYPAYFTTRPAHTVKIISIFNLINQSKSCQQIHIKVTLYKPLNPSCLHNFNRASVRIKEYKICHASGFHVSEELVSTITCTTTLIPVRFPHSEIVIEKSSKQFIIQKFVCTEVFVFFQQGNQNTRDISEFWPPILNLLGNLAQTTKKLIHHSN